MGKRKQKRKVKFVDREVQGALLRRIILHWLAFIVVSFVSVTMLQILVGDPNLTVAEKIGVAWGQYALFGVVLISLLPAFLLDSLRLSNRFAGPIMRLRRALRQVADGETVAELKFREGDFWKEISTDFERAFARLQQNEQSELEEKSTKSVAS